MTKLYKIDSADKLYWEFWDNQDGSFTIHWGELGTQGESKVIKPSLLRWARGTVKRRMKAHQRKGYRPIDADDYRVLLIEYAIEGMGTREDVAKRHSLEERMNSTLGWTGLGSCDGGSIGSGTMDVCCNVVDLDLAKAVIEKDLVDTGFKDYTRIYAEAADS